jgi:hypothetical protein
MGTASVLRMPDSGETIDIARRYQKGYRTAQNNIFFGEFVRAVGALAAALMTMGTVVFSGRSPEELLVGIFLAVTGGMAVYCLGAILCAQGHMLQASLDIAANSSPFLSTAVKANIMR